MPEICQYHEELAKTSAETNAIVKQIKDNHLAHIEARQVKQELDFEDFKEKSIDDRGKLNGKLGILIGLVTAEFIALCGVAWGIISGVIH